MRWLRGLSIRTIIFGSFTLVLLLTMGPALVLVSNSVDRSLRGILNARGSDLARSLAERGALPFHNEQMGRDAIRALGQISRDEGFAILADRELSNSLVGTDGVDAQADVAPTLAALRRGADFAGRSEGIDLGGGRFLWAYPAKERQIDAEEGTLDGPEQVVGYAVVVLSDRQVAEAKSRVRGMLMLAFVGGVFGFLLLMFFVSRIFIIRPLDAMMSAAKKISDCDLTGQLVVAGEDEFSQLGAALNRTAENLRATLARVKGVTEGIGSVIGQIGQTGDMVARGAATTARSVDETSSSMEAMTRSIKGIAENVEVLAQSAEESSTSIVRMASANDEVAENIRGLAASVEETTAAIEQMTNSLKQTARNIEDLSSTAEETSSSMSEMDISIGQVEMNANETAKLSELVSQDADTGVKALQKTIGGIDRIRDSSREAAQVIESLGRKIGTIGKILNVIDDVAEQTNLLALNAAIIAAQAGEHGKGFAIVADEIKDLAERTGESTKEIAQLIQGIQDESRNAVRAMERGIKSVDDGVRLGGEAAGALRKINESAGKATQMVKAIARATVEQARGSRQVTGAIHRIAETVQQIARGTAEQARGSEQIMNSAERMRAITKHVEATSQDQARGSKAIARSIENINEMVSHLNRAQKDQTRGSEHVMREVASIKSVADQQNRSMAELEQAIEALAREAEVLRAEVRRFRV